MPSLRTQKRGQRAGHDRTDRQPTASRIRPNKTCRSRREFERDRHRSLGHFDRPVQMGRLLEVPIGLASGQVELAGQAPHCFGQRDTALQQMVSGVQLSSLVRFGRSSHVSYEYYLLRRKSSTEDLVRQPLTTLSNSKLPFAIRDRVAQLIVRYVSNGVLKVF